MAKPVADPILSFFKILTALTPLVFDCLHLRTSPLDPLPMVRPIK